MNNNQNNFQNGPFNIPPQNNPHSPPNTSGQNDPEGSKRFNIFLTRSFSGQHGIIGTIAPPTAGNLFT